MLVFFRLPEKNHHDKPTNNHSVLSQTDNLEIIVTLHDFFINRLHKVRKNNRVIIFTLNATNHFDYLKITIGFEQITKANDIHSYFCYNENNY